MFIHDRSRGIVRKLQHVARVAHRHRERMRLLCVETAEINRHQQRRELVIRNRSGDTCSDYLLDLLFGQRAAIAFALDQHKEIHERKFATRCVKAISKDWADRKSTRLNSSHVSE